MSCYTHTQPTYSDIDATLPPLSTCSSKICFTSITQDLDLDIVQLGCWEDLSDTPRCYREAKSIICLCSTHLCNGSPPSLLPASPEITAFHVALFVLLIFVFMVCLGIILKRFSRNRADSLICDLEKNNDPGKFQQIQEISRGFRILNEEKIHVKNNDIDVESTTSCEEEDGQSLGFQEIVYIQEVGR